MTVPSTMAILSTRLLLTGDHAGGEREEVRRHGQGLPLVGGEGVGYYVVGVCSVERWWGEPRLSHGAHSAIAQSHRWGAAVPPWAPPPGVRAACCLVSEAVVRVVLTSSLTFLCCTIHNISKRGAAPDRRGEDGIAGSLIDQRTEHTGRCVA